MLGRPRAGPRASDHRAPGPTLASVKTNAADQRICGAFLCIRNFILLVQEIIVLRVMCQPLATWASHPFDCRENSLFAFWVESARRIPSGDLNTTLRAFLSAVSKVAKLQTSLSSSPALANIQRCELNMSIDEFL